MDDGEGPSAAGAVVCRRDARGWWLWSEAVGAEIVRRTAAGETLRGLCREPGMPEFRTVQRWLTGKPAFRAAMEEARVAAGGPFRGRRTGYCQETAEAIWARLSAGEPLVKIVADPAMPCWSTVHKWMNEQPAFRQALHSARTWLAEQAFQTGWDICMGVTPATAQAAKVQLAHLRWHTGKLAPKTYGPHKAAEPGGRGEGALHVYLKKFVMGEGREPGQWSEEPAEHLYSMVPVGDKGPNAGKPLPPPEAVREPRTCLGPNPSRVARGGAVEAEREAEDDAGADDFWTSPAHGHLSDEDWT
jgi:hypothetical protein